MGGGPGRDDGGHRRGGGTTLRRLRLLRLHAAQVFGDREARLAATALGPGGAAPRGVRAVGHGGGGVRAAHLRHERVRGPRRRPRGGARRRPAPAGGGREGRLAGPAPPRRAGPRRVRAVHFGVRGVAAAHAGRGRGSLRRGVAAAHEVRDVEARLAGAAAVPPVAPLVRQAARERGAVVEAAHLEGRRGRRRRRRGRPGGRAGGGRLGGRGGEADGGLQGEADGLVGGAAVAGGAGGVHRAAERGVVVVGAADVAGLAQGDGGKVDGREEGQGGRPSTLASTAAVHVMVYVGDDSTVQLSY